MTTAHRPTFDPARGKEAQRGPAYHQRLLPAHSVLKTRQVGQGTIAETSRRDLRTQLLQAEAAHFAKTRGDPDSTNSIAESEAGSNKRRLEAGEKDTDTDDEEGEEDIDSKRRRILEETRNIDADSDESEEDSSEEESDEDDVTDDLMRELEKIKREKAEQREREVRLLISQHPRSS